MIRWLRARRLRQLEYRTFEYTRLVHMTVDPEERWYWRTKLIRTEDKIERLRRRSQLPPSLRLTQSFIDEWESR